MLRRLALGLYDLPPALLALTTLFWAGNTIAGKLAVGEIAPFQLVFARWILVAGVLWLLYGKELRAHWPTARPRLREIVLMASLGFTAFNGLFYLAALQTSAVNIGILQGAIPVFVLLMAYFAYGTRIGAVQVLGVALTLAGVVVVATAGSPFSLFTLGIGPGDGLMLLACLFYGFYTTALQRRPKIPGRALFTLMSIIAALTSLPFWLAEAVISAPPWPTPEGWAVTLYVAIFPSCLAQLFFLRGVDLVGPGPAGVYVNLVPVFSPLLAILILGERFAGFHALSLALVLGGIWLAQRRARSG
ncbi:DMT family transporter [Paralimibaculum aggregatum]|uniref:DMT family transporter n=1 Tax=Paralimibaculum aggregatum TaxID=3036245 RepID=A0ABQ6LSL4_9RHOB|nr:DMT family transporter [Limibaculum sp. NKW23]GMG85067.1 DMT family transporter [Limibaculum sp. NKW23]